MELWRSIKDYPNYQVSNLGSIRSLNYNNQKIINNLKPAICASGYYGVGFSLKGKTKTFLIHRLVGIYFITNPKNKLEINHKDGNKLNNHYNNLEWCTRLENAKHASNNNLLRKGINHYLYGKTNGNHHITKRIINTKTKEIWESVNILSAFLGIKPNTLASKLNGKNYNNTDFIYLK
jgi:hypothetical protein